MLSSSSSLWMAFSFSSSLRLFSSHQQISSVVNNNFKSADHAGGQFSLGAPPQQSNTCFLHSTVGPSGMHLVSESLSGLTTTLLISTVAVFRNSMQAQSSHPWIKVCSKFICVVFSKIFDHPTKMNEHVFFFPGALKHSHVTLASAQIALPLDCVMSSGNGMMSLFHIQKQTISCSPSQDTTTSAVSMTHCGSIVTERVPHKHTKWTFEMNRGSVIQSSEFLTPHRLTVQQFECLRVILLLLLCLQTEHDTLSPHAGWVECLLVSQRDHGLCWQIS